VKVPVKIAYGANALPPEPSPTCQNLAGRVLHLAGVAAKHADICDDAKLKERQRDLAINIALTVGIDEGVAGELFYKSYAEESRKRDGCDMEAMIATAEAFNDVAEATIDRCNPATQ
jgi:hypothetical protein